MPQPPTLAPGMRVLCRDAEWLIHRVDPSDYAHVHHAVHCVGVDDLVRGHQAIFLTQLDEISPVDPRETKLVQDDSNGFRLSKLFLEAQLRQMPATGIEPDLEGMGAFEAMDFQVFAAEVALKQLRPRLLLADAVGLGKTIEVGMILTELMRRGRANRILVLAKKSMLTQFQAELWNRFAIPLVRLDSQGIAKLRLRIPANKNPFEVYQRIIISIDTLKDVGRYRHFLEDTRWDCVVIDEAHNVAGASVPDNHLAHRLARLLSRRTDSMLLTTATPHNGKRETFGRLISLLDPSAIPDPSFREYSASDIKGFFLMRFKEDVKAEAAGNLTDREVVPRPRTTVDATTEEEQVYTVLAEMREASKKPGGVGRGKGESNQTLIAYGLYKQFLSSPESCRSTVQKRLTKLTEDDPDSPEAARLSQLDDALDGLTLAQSSRYQLLKQQLSDIGWTGGTDSPRVLLFTEYRLTQDALAVALAKDFGINHSTKFEDQAQQTIASISGSCPDVHLMSAVEAFATRSSPVRMMIATDVASEGINLHHQCHNVIHYDLPWSIITLIQRNGRIDRFGQKETPVLRYLMVSTQNEELTGDDEIFDRLIEKVEEINRTARSGESQLKLYDAAAEEQYIAEQGLIKGDKDVLERRIDASSSETAEATELEQTINDGNLKDRDDLLAFLLGEGDAAEAQDANRGSNDRRLRFYADRDFLTEGYDYLRDKDSRYLPVDTQGQLVTLTAPSDLKRRLGAPDDRGDVIFGATAIPRESWPENDQFRLTDKPDRVNLAIQAARNTSGYWSKELLCAEQHPILLWLTERLLMQIGRGEAPVITSRQLPTGEMCFCFIGQVSSKAGSPLVVDAHSVVFGLGGQYELKPLRDSLSEAGFESLANTEVSARRDAAEALLGAAVDSSLDHLHALEKQRQEEMLPLLRREERRLRNWSKKRRELIEAKLDKLATVSKTAKRLSRELKEMDQYIKDRSENWRDTHLLPGEHPSTRLVLVIEGVD
jgi:ERCC4-related helicase